LESIQANVDWVNKNKEAAVEWMKSHTGHLAIQDVEETLQELEHLNPNLPSREDRGYARNEYYYRDQEEPQYDMDYYRQKTGNYYD